jgi:hypothetical protein
MRLLSRFINRWKSALVHQPGRKIEEDAALWEQHRDMVPEGSKMDNGSEGGPYYGGSGY